MPGGVKARYAVKVGDRYGQLCVVEPAHRRERYVRKTRREMSWCVTVRCQCGSQFECVVRSLVRGVTTRCRLCINRDISETLTTHGQEPIGLYRCWSSMLSRCTSRGNHSWKRYGGRGITVCSAWQASFLEFKTWAEANGYKPELQLDRIDNDSGYAPDNCRWVTPRQNANNTSANRRLTAFGRTRTVAEWAREKECTVSPITLRARLSRGWEIEKAIATPARSYGNESGK